MDPVIFWLFKIRIGKNEHYSKSLFRCEIFKDRLEVYHKEARIIRFPLRDILKVKLKYKRYYYSYVAYNEITLANGLEKITVVPANPLNPTEIFYANFVEAKKFKKVIDEIREFHYTTIEANPYVRNKRALKFIKEFEKLDLELHPNDFYERYFKEYNRRILWLQLVVGFVSVILTLLVMSIIMNILY